jgi:hypothetical protein
MPCPQLSSVIHLWDPDAKISRSRRGAGTTYIVFFITGNPGLVEYYRTFLTHLYGLLSTSTAVSHESVAFQVYGRSLAGFEVEGETPCSDSSSNSRNAAAQDAPSPPYGLQEQIQSTEKALQNLIKSSITQGIQHPRVILIGHSVGSYILLELVRRSRARLLSEPNNRTHIVSGICLFPTVTHIAKSRSGRRGGVSMTLPLGQIYVVRMIEKLC